MPRTRLVQLVLASRTHRPTPNHSSSSRTPEHPVATLNTEIQYREYHILTENYHIINTKLHKRLTVKRVLTMLGLLNDDSHLSSDESRFEGNKIREENAQKKSVVKEI